jgi:hypothetical protein
MQTIFDYIDQNPPEVVFAIVMVGFVGWLIYEYKNAPIYDGDDF